MPQTIFQQSHHAAGSAPDTVPLEIKLNPPAMVIDFAIFDNIALLSFSSDGIYFGTPREIPAGVLASLNLQVRAFRVVNKVAGQIARYDLTAYYNPVEVVGVPFQPVIKS